MLIDPKFLNIQLNTSYLNRTPNKEQRANGGYRPIACLWHETAGLGSLDYCLQPTIRASFNYLIDRNGAIYHYVDERSYIAWGGGIGPSGTVNGISYNGLSYWRVEGTTYRGSSLNSAFIHIELEGPNDGTPITGQQTESAIILMLYCAARYNIPLDAVRHPEHAQVAPTYKTDALGYSAETIRQLAIIRATPAAPQTGYAVDSRLIKLWDALGGLGREIAGLGWVSGPGWAIGDARPAPDGNGIIQPCERYWIGLDKDKKPRLPLANEVKNWGL